MVSLPGSLSTFGETNRYSNNHGRCKATVYYGRKRFAAAKAKKNAGWAGQKHPPAVVKLSVSKERVTLSTSQLPL